MNATFNYILGYFLGIGLFYITIPAFLVGLHTLPSSFSTKPLFPISWFLYILTSILLFIGLTFALWSNICLRTMGKGGPTDGFGKAVSPRTQILVTSGPYRYTRNPMAFGTFLCYFALALYLNSIPVVVFLAILLPVALAYIRRWEERRLSWEFGREYAEYRRRVSMFFPRIPSRLRSPGP
jgi:protein-S-isoprenylcysteine O-methyltransferase Ste14